MRTGGAGPEGGAAAERHLDTDGWHTLGCGHRVPDRGGGPNTDFLKGLDMLDGKGAIKVRPPKADSMC